jgi:hypothetical protein
MQSQFLQRQQLIQQNALREQQQQFLLRWATFVCMPTFTSSFKTNVICLALNYGTILFLCFCSLVQGQTGSGSRKESESWQGHQSQQQSQGGGPQLPGGTAQLQAQMLLNMAKSAGITGSDGNPIEHLQALFQRQAQVRFQTSLT